MKNKIIGIVAGILVIQPVMSQALIPEKYKRLAVAFPLAYAAYRALDYASVVCHEYGHALTQKAFTSDPIDITIKPSFWGTSGFSRAKTDLHEHRIKNALMIAAGPIAGIAATHLGFTLLNRFDESDDPTIFHFMKRLYTEAKYGKPYSKLAPIPRDCIDMLKSMCCARIISEIVYGFLPVGTVTTYPNQSNESPGDGQQIWAALLKRDKQNYPRISEKILSYAPLAVCAPILLARGEAFYAEKFK